MSGIRSWQEQGKRHGNVYQNSDVLNLQLSLVDSSHGKVKGKLVLNRLSNGNVVWFLMAW